MPFPTPKYPIEQNIFEEKLRRIMQEAAGSDSCILQANFYKHL